MGLALPPIRHSSRSGATSPACRTRLGDCTSNRQIGTPAIA